MSRARAIRLFWIGAAATLVVAALLALTAVLGGSFDHTDWQILGALGTLLIGGAVSTVGVSLRETSRAELFGAVLAFGAPVLALVGLIAMARDFRPDGLGKLAGIAYVLLAAGLIVGTARVLMRQRNQLLPFVSVAVTASLAAVMSAYAIATDSGSHGKELGSTLIVMALAYVLIPVWRRLAADTPPERAVRQVDLVRGVAVSGVHVRLAPAAATEVGHDTVVFVLAGRAVAGPSTVSAGHAVLAPAGTSIELTPDGGAILIGR